ncbi:TPA: hypothetical protein ACG0QE_000463 [Pseudomonas aeruginosa]|nr:hypothetical protein [Pseudomonas aeruginosa]HEJ4180219.1 hypothetical protein [Pseudomonas aeruginosa]
MQLNVERGAPMTGKSVRLFQTHLKAGQASHKILRGTHYTPRDLEQRVRHYISLGATVICIDECSEQQIKHLRHLKGDIPSDLTIHAVVAN